MDYNNENGNIASRVPLESRGFLQRNKVPYIILLFSEYLVFYIGMFPHYRILKYLETVLNIVIISDDKIAMSSFPNLYIESLGVLIIHLVLYCAIRLIRKHKTHYIEMQLVLTVVSAIMLIPALLYKEEMFAYLSLTLALWFVFPTLTFACFAVAISQLDKYTKLKGSPKILIAIASGTIVGLLVSRLAWIPIVTYYLR